MKALRIVGGNAIKNWWCKSCKRASEVIIKVGNQSFCDECIPEQFKDKLVTVNQNREEI